MKFWVIVFVIVGTLRWASAQPAQIILIRHAEKPADPEALHLSKEGRKRAKALVPFLTNSPALTQHGLPVALFAAQPTKHGHGLRTQETIAPLAKALHLKIETPFLSENYPALAKLILNNPKYEGKAVLICWVHAWIPQLAAALGVRPEPPKWKGEVYDKVYSITYEGGQTTLKVLSETPSTKAAKFSPR